MKRKEFYDTINNIILDMFSNQLKNITINVNFINKTNNLFTKFHKDTVGLCNTKSPTEYNIFISKRPDLIDADIEYFKNFNIPIEESKIIHILLHEYGHIIQMVKLYNANPRLYDYLRISKNMNMDLSSFILGILDAHPYVKAILDPSESFADAFAYRNFPIVVNKLNEIKNNKK